MAPKTCNYYFIKRIVFGKLNKLVDRFPRCVE